MLDESQLEYVMNGLKQALIKKSEKCNECLKEYLEGKNNGDSVYPKCGLIVLNSSPCYWLDWLDVLERKENLPVDRERIKKLIKRSLEN